MISPVSPQLRQWGEAFGGNNSSEMQNLPRHVPPHVLYISPVMEQPGIAF